MLKARSIGVMGGGQLGRMLAHAAQRLGMTVTVLDPQADCPAGQAADAHLQAAYDDHRALDELASRCDAITTEFENVPSYSLVRLAQAKPVRPSADAVAIAQDRLLEKQFFLKQVSPPQPFGSSISLLMGRIKHPSKPVTMRAFRQSSRPDD